jgi:hypothetical protein
MLLLRWRKRRVGSLLRSPLADAAGTILRAAWRPRP